MRDVGDKSSCGPISSSAASADAGRNGKRSGAAEGSALRGPGPLAEAVGNLAERRTGDRRGAIDVIDQPGNVIENQGEVRIELAFYRRRPCAEDWRFDVYLIHYWDGERMPAV